MNEKMPEENTTSNPKEKGHSISIPVVNDTPEVRNIDPHNGRYTNETSFETKVHEDPNLPEVVKNTRDFLDKRKENRFETGSPTFLNPNDELGQLLQAHGVDPKNMRPEDAIPFLEKQVESYDAIKVPHITENNSNPHIEEEQVSSVEEAGAPTEQQPVPEQSVVAEESNSNIPKEPVTQNTVGQPASQQESSASETPASQQEIPTDEKQTTAEEKKEINESKTQESKETIEPTINPNGTLDKPYYVQKKDGSVAEIVTGFAVDGEKCSLIDGVPYLWKNLKISDKPIEQPEPKSDSNEAVAEAQTPDETTEKTQEDTEKIEKISVDMSDFKPKHPEGTAQYKVEKAEYIHKKQEEELKSAIGNLPFVKRYLLKVKRAYYGNPTKILKTVTFVVLLGYAINSMTGNDSGDTPWMEHWQNLVGSGDTPPLDTLPEMNPEMLDVDTEGVTSMSTQEVPPLPDDIPSAPSQGGSFDTTAQTHDLPTPPPEIPEPPLAPDTETSTSIKDTIRIPNSLEPTVDIPSSLEPTVPENISDVIENFSQPHDVLSGENNWKIIEGNIKDFVDPEHLTQATDELKDVLVELSPQELREMGISSGNASLIYPSDTIDYTSFLERSDVQDILEKYNTNPDVSVHDALGSMSADAPTPTVDTPTDSRPVPETTETPPPQPAETPESSVPAEQVAQNVNTVEGGGRLRGYVLSDWLSSRGYIDGGSDDAQTINEFVRALADPQNQDVVKAMNLPLDANAPVEGQINFAPLEDAIVNDPEFFTESLSSTMREVFTALSSSELDPKNFATLEDIAKDTYNFQELTNDINGLSRVNNLSNELTGILKDKGIDATGNDVIQYVRELLDKKGSRSAVSFVNTIFGTK
jgi:hypothetical protein